MLQNRIFFKNEDRDPWDNFKHINIHNIGVPEGEERKSGKLFENKMTETFHTLGKETDTQVQGAQKFPRKMNPKRNTLRYLIIKMVNNKDKES